MTHEYETLLVEQTGPVLKITVNRPEVLNAQSMRLRWELDDSFERAVQDDSVRVIILAGAGEHFSAGHDLGSPQELEDEAKSRYANTIIGHFERVWDLSYSNSLRWRDIPKPAIAQVQGYCIMGGLSFATPCDLIVAAADAMFCDRAVRWGGAHVQYASLPWEIGIRKAKEYLWTGDWITAEEALRLGLVNRVVPREKLDEETMALAQRIALNDPFALRMSKLSINAAQDAMGFRQALLSSFVLYNVANAAALEARRLAGGDGRAERSPKGAKARDKRFGDGGAI